MLSTPSVRTTKTSIEERMSSEDDSRPVLQVCDKDLHSRASEFANRHGWTTVKVVRRALEEFLPGDNMNVPCDPKLRESYLWLQKRTDDRNRVPSSEAISDLAQKLSIKEKYVKTSQLEPLKRAGWIHPKYTYIEVVDPTIAQDRLGEE